jgi:peptidyl-prolyl cis-trans isomerase SurA
MKTFITALILALALLARPGAVAAQALSAESLDAIIAIVEDDVILRSELDRAVGTVFAQYGNRPDLPSRDVIERQVLDRLILIRLQLQRAEGTGIRISDTELDQSVLRLAQQNGATLDQLRASLERDGFSYEEFRNTMREELAVQRLRQRFLQSRVNVTDTEIDLLLASDSIQRGEVRLSHILIGVPDGATPEQLTQARDKAARVNAELTGGADFAATAIRYSDGQQALEGGDLGWRRYNEVPEVFQEVIATMKLGDVTPPMRGPSGFHIIKLVDQRASTKDMVREYNARHIMVKVSELVSNDEARASVENIHRRIQAGEDFATLAKEFSEDTTSANLGGDMGWFQVGAFGTRVAQVIESLSDNQLSEPFQTEVGWHLLQRLGTRDTDKTVEMAREQARDIIRNRKADEEYETFLRQMKAESYIENRLTGTGTSTGDPVQAEAAPSAGS